MNSKRNDRLVRKIIFNITQQLSIDDVKNAFFIIGTNSKTSCQDVHELRQILEKHNYFNVRKANFKRLIELLGDIERVDLQKQLEKEEEKLQQYRNDNDDESSSLGQMNSEETECKSPELNSSETTNLEGNDDDDESSSLGQMNYEETECKSPELNSSETTNLEGNDDDESSSLGQMNSEETECKSPELNSSETTNLEGNNDNEFSSFGQMNSEEFECQSPEHNSSETTHLEGNNDNESSSLDQMNCEETECKSPDLNSSETTNLEDHGVENSSELDASNLEVDFSSLTLHEDLTKAAHSTVQEPHIKPEDNSFNNTANDMEPEITLYNYQVELGVKAKKGINSIICSPTGSGKTITAASVIKHHLDEARQRDVNYRVLYLVHIRNLVIHLSTDLRKILKEDVYCLNEDILNSEVVKNQAVVILTAQILLNALKDKKVSLSSYDLLVFDECHNTVGNHPYKKIMMEYHELKRNQKKVPQVVGLSATLAGGSDPFKSIVKLCTNMHILSVSSVCNEKNRQELLEKNKAPEIDGIILCEPRLLDNDDFFLTISTLMEEFLVKLGKIYEIELGDFKFGQLDFESNLSQTKNTCDICNNREASKILEFLIILNKALMYYNDLTAYDAVYYLNEKLKEPDKFDLPIVMSIFKSYKTIYAKLRDFAMKDKLENNNKLSGLKKLLKEFLEPNPEKKVIIFCQQKFNTVHLKELLAEDGELKRFLKAEHLVGQTSEIGLTQNQQRNVLKKFESNEINVLVTTSIAEQGLNIPSCEIVIRYAYITSDISRRQSQGRARAENSKCFLIVDKNAEAIFREYRNKEKEKEMDLAVIKVVEMGEENFKQLICKEIAHLHAELNEKRPFHQYPYDANKVIIFCKVCHCQLCYGSDVINKGSDYICINPDFKQKVREFPIKEKKFRMDSNIAISVCKGPQCDNKFGAIKKYYFGDRKYGFVLNVRNILFQFVENGQKSLLKQWSKHPFEIKAESLT